MKNFTTCKLIFAYGVTKEDVTKLLAKYTEHGSIANFESDRTVGCNRTAFAVVDVPDLVIHKLVNDKIVKDLDLMSSYSMPMTGECGSGCGCA